MIKYLQISTDTFLKSLLIVTGVTILLHAILMGIHCIKIKVTQDRDSEEEMDGEAMEMETMQTGGKRSNIY